MQRIRFVCGARMSGRHIVSAYMTFVAMGDNGKPRPVPQLLPETELERHRYEEAQLRRASRLAHTDALRALRAKAGRIGG